MEYLLSKHPKIQFSIDKEEGRWSFTFFRYKHVCEKFAIDVYRRKTFNGVYTKFKRFIPEGSKIRLIKSLLFRYFSLRSDFIKFHHENDKLNCILYKNIF